MTQADALSSYDKYLRDVLGERVSIQYANHEKGLNVILLWSGLIDETAVEPAVTIGYAKSGLKEFFDFGGSLRSTGLYTQTLIRKTTP
jgi:hypothetical protein